MSDLIDGRRCNGARLRYITPVATVPNGQFMNLSAIHTRIAAALAALILGSAGAGMAQAKVFDPQTFTLANGLQVVVVENHRAPVVTHMVWYRCGAADEKPGKTGIAHFLEHLMFKGTKTVPPGAFSTERGALWRRRERLHLIRLHRLFPIGGGGAPGRRDAARGRPHGQSRAHRRGSAAGTRRDPGRAAAAHRQRAGRAPVGDDARQPVSSIIPIACPSSAGSTRCVA